MSALGEILGEGAGAAEADQRIAHDGDGDGRQQIAEATLLEEAFEEDLAARRDDDVPDVADDEDAAQGELAQRDVARLGAVDARRRIDRQRGEPVRARLRPSSAITALRSPPASRAAISALGLRPSRALKKSWMALSPAPETTRS